MKLIVGNIATVAVVGGSDNLLDIDVMEELRKYLRIKPDGYGQSTAYKKKQWDGWKYFITKKGQFATGFLPLVAQHLESMGVDIEVEDDRGDVPEMLVEDLDNWIGQIDGKPWTARDYQLDLVKKLDNYITISGEPFYFPRGILDAATNAGKNSVAALIVNNLIQKYNTIFLVSNRTIYEQAVEFFTQVIEEPVGEIKSGKYAPKWFTVAMVKTLNNKAEKSLNVRKYLNDMDVLIVDESDEAGAKEYSRVLSYINAPMRIFVSGTPLEAKKVNNMVAIGLSGKVLGTVKNKFLIDEGYSQKPIVTMLLNRTRRTPLAPYTQEVKETIHTSMERVELISGIIEEHSDKSILISFIEKEHGYFMYENLQKLHPNIDMDIVHGTSKDRSGIIENYKKGRTTVLFSSMILKRGANIPNIEVLVLAQGGKSTITVKQLSGRALRHDGKSDTVLLYDFYDLGKYVAKHSRDRVRIYKKEEFEVIETYETKRGVAILK